MQLTANPDGTFTLAFSVDEKTAINADATATLTSAGSLVLGTLTTSLTSLVAAGRAALVSQVTAKVTTYSPTQLVAVIAGLP